MISIRSLILILLIFLIWRLGKKWYQAFLANQQNSNPPPIKKVPHGVMVRCSYCQLHLPKEEAIQLGEIYFCCQAHQHAAQQQDYAGTH